MKRARRTSLARIRKAIVMQYHNLSEVIMDESFDDDGKHLDKPDGEVDAAYDMLDNAINCLNRELGRAENS